MKQGEEDVQKQIDRHAMEMQQLKTHTFVATQSWCCIVLLSFFQFPSSCGCAWQARIRNWRVQSASV